MHFLSFPTVVLSLASLAAAGSSHSRREHAPHQHELEARSLELEARGLSAYSGKLPEHPLFVYNNAQEGLPPKPSTLQGFNMYAMTFWRTDGLHFNAKTWTNAGQAKQKAIHAEYKKAGIPLLVAAFGDAEEPTTAKKNPITVANDLAKWIKANNVDGVDVDYEDFDACWAQTCAAWVIKFHTQLRKNLGSKYIITHAPIAPWFTTANTFAGGYLAVDKAVGSSIDLYLVQFYNQGKQYATCAEIVTGGVAERYDQTALMEIIASGVPKEKLLIGKPADPKDAGSGYTNLALLNKCVKEAKAKGWNTGLMAWAWPSAGAVHFLQKVWRD